jgi:hypothetical protein
MIPPAGICEKGEIFERVGQNRRWGAARFGGFARQAFATPAVSGGNEYRLTSGILSPREAKFNPFRLTITFQRSTSKRLARTR